MDVRKKAKKLHKEADKLLYKQGLHDILKKHARVFYTGSYYLDLMVWPDIDIYISIFDDPFDKQIFFEIGNQLAQLPQVISLKFQDHHTYPHKLLPDGLYWNIRINNDQFKTPWKVDIWALDSDSIEQALQDIEQIKQQLNEQNRLKILKIKESLINEKGRTPILSGYHIYQAILFKGITDRDEIVRYLKKKGIYIG